MFLESLLLGQFPRGESGENQVLLGFSSLHVLKLSKEGKVVWPSVTKGHFMLGISHFSL